MEKEFVTYEIAKEIKELGFDCPVFATFDYKNEIKLREDFIKTTEKLKAPLWQQVIDWLREKYDIHIVITVYPYSEIIEVNGYKIYMEINASLCTVINNETESWSYYKAREQAILKAIEIIKQK